MKINDVDVIFRTSVEHRGALVLRGPGLNPNVSATDNHAGALETCRSLDDTPEAKKTADIVNRFTALVEEKLADAPENKGREKPANIILLRGAGKFTRVPSFEQRFNLRAACVAGGALYKGVARFVGMDVLSVPGATGDGKTDLRAKANAAVKALDNHDFIFLHIKGCDSAGHDGDFDGKKKMLERIDREVLPVLEKSGAYLIITGDHSTPVSRKAHSGHEVPVLVYGKDERKDAVTKFDEISCAAGGLGHIEGRDIVPLILNLLEKAKKYGS